MLLSSILTASLFWIVATTTPTDDLIRLQQTCDDITSSLNASLNNTAALNTSDLIQSVGYQIGASLSNLGCIGAVSPPRSGDVDPADQLDAVYLNYTASLSDLASAVISRGRIMHTELNEPVSLALAGVASAVYALGTCLSNGDLISRAATIRTWRAGSNIVEAESAWNDYLNYPGRRRSARSVRTVRAASVPRRPAK